MSGPGSVNPKRREIEIIRVLFDRHLADRAVALAESRWPGSGDVVRLAYEWDDLSPGERRDRISTIGPAEIARLRELTALHPDLQQTVDELDRRGVLPNLEQAALAGAASMAGAEATNTTQPDVTMAPENVIEATQPVEDVSPTEQTVAEPVQDPLEAPELEAMQSPPVEIPEEMHVDMPALDIGLPDTETFLEEETRRRAEAAQETEAAMARVRERLERAANRTWSRTFPTATLPGIAPMKPLADLPALTTPSPNPAETLPRQANDTNLVEAPQRILDAFKESRVLSLATPEEAPSDDELVAIANELGLGMREFSLGPGRTRDLYGGLGRVGSQIKVTAGPLPSALAASNLVIVHGRIYPMLIDRLNAGFADIPGTRATVKVHPDARVLIIPT